MGYNIHHHQQPGANMRKQILIATALAALQAQAADWTFKGSARFATFGTTVMDDANDETTNSAEYRMQNNSRFSASVREGATGGTAEFGARASDKNITLRKLYGTWFISPDMELLVGQDYTLFDQSNPNQVYADDNDLVASGATYEPRSPQMRLTLGGLKIVLLNGKQAELELADGTLYEPAPALAPKIELGYGINTGNLSLKAATGYNGYSVETETTPAGLEDSYYIPSVVANLAFTLKVDQMSILGSVGYAMNPTEFGLETSSPFTSYLDADGDIVNTSSLEAYLAINAPVDPSLIPEAGFGMERSSQEFGDETASLTRMTAYVQASLKPADKVSFVPEIGGIWESGTDQAGGDFDNPTTLYYGLKTQIDF